jgi:hypothetical protein
MEIAEPQQPLWGSGEAAEGIQQAGASGETPLSQQSTPVIVGAAAAHEQLDGPTGSPTDFLINETNNLSFDMASLPFLDSN